LQLLGSFSAFCYCLILAIVFVCALLGIVLSALLAAGILIIRILSIPFQ
jgi:hypothetical protein